MHEISDTRDSLTRKAISVSCFGSLDLDALALDYEGYGLGVAQKFGDRLGEGDEYPSGRMVIDTDLELGCVLFPFRQRRGVVSLWI